MLEAISTRWSAYEPTTQSPWTLKRVLHLHRRAGFSATWAESQRDLSDGVDAAVDRLINGNAYSTGVPDDFDSMSTTIGSAAVASGSPDRLKAWWLYRMIYSPDPLTERLTLMWHNHFATSNLKVDNIAAMHRQNQVLRKGAMLPFGQLLKSVVKDPAMLIWLDADSNRKQHPNENLARELMELFTVGVGNYTEQDVQQAARALTGWTTKRGEFRSIDIDHDDGAKSFLGEKGTFSGDDVLRILIDHPSTARRVAWRLCDYFFGENAIDEDSIETLADDLHQRNLDVRWAVKTILRSEAFFADNNIGNRVLSPVEYIVGAVRALELLRQPPSTLVMSEWTTRLGQDLFYPPNVFGWPGGRNWLTTRSMVGRAALAGEIVSGSLRRPIAAPDIAVLSELVDGTDSKRRLLKFAATMFVPNAQADYHERLFRQARHADANLILRSVLSSAEAQLG